MADRSVFGRLKRLFSTGVIIRNTGGNQLSVVDPDRIQSVGNTNTNNIAERFSRMYRSSTSFLYNAAVDYPTLRIQLYNDYEAMDSEAIIASALDVIADECTLKNENREVLQIISSDERVQKILYNLFYDVLNIEFNLWPWIRNMCKYGDFYLYLKISDEFGVFNVEPLIASELLRKEGENPKNPQEVWFELDKQATSRTYESMGKDKDHQRLENYEIAHFRLLADVNYLPFGRCTELHSRVYTENSIKEIRHIIPGDKVWTYNVKEDKYELANVLNVACNGVKQLINIRTRHNEIKCTLNHPILVLNEETKEFEYKLAENIVKGDYVACSNLKSDIKQDAELELLHTSKNIEVFKVEDIIEELPDEVWDIQVDRNSNFIAEGIIVHNSYLEPARKTYKQYVLLKDSLLLHRIMRSPEKRIFYVDVGSIPPNEIPAHMQTFINSMKKTPYLDPQTGDYNLKFNVQNQLEDFYIPVRGTNQNTRIETTKGLDYNGIDDVNFMRDEMLAALKVPKAYFGFEKDLCVVPETQIPLINGEIKTISELIEDYENGISNYVYSLDSKLENVGGKISWAGYTRRDTIVVRVSLNNEKYIDCTPDHNFMIKNGEWKEAQYLKEEDSLRTLFLDNGNEVKVSKVEFLEEVRDTCDIQVEDYHNFLTSADIFIHNSGKATLASEDIRFARTIERIQRIVISELTKIALVHLYVQGFEKEQLVNFELQLTPPSIIYQQEQVALWKEKVELTRNMLDTGIISTDWIYENIFQMSEDQYDNMRDLIVEDKKRLFRLNQIENEGNDPAKTNKSFGTPHDLAALYGKGRMNNGDIPKGFDEDKIDAGRPQEKVSTYGTQQAPLGKDPIGKKEISKRKDANNINPSFKGNSPLALENMIDGIEKSYKSKDDKRLIIFEEKSNLLSEDNIRNDQII